MLRVFIFCLVLFLALSLRLVWYFSSQEVYYDGQKVEIRKTLLDNPRITEGKNGFSGYQIIYTNRLKIIFPRFPEYHYADNLLISGIVSRQEYGNEKSKVLNKEISFVMKNPKIEPVKNEKDLFSASVKSLLSLTSYIRQKVEHTFNLYLARDEASLLMGIVFGIKSQMNNDYFTALKNAGVMHVIAASGMNVTMVGGFLEGIFILILKRQFALVLTLFGIVFYAVLSGLEPSIIRASVMAVFAYSAAILGKQNFSYISLVVTAFVMLMLEPDLMQDVGFQLSFSSTLGILSIKPVLSKITAKSFISGIGVGDDFLTTFSAQAVSLPIMLTSFSSYNPVSILVNMLVLWTIPPLMILGGVGAIAGLILPFLGQICLYLSLPFLLFFKKTVMLFSGLPGKISVDVRNENFPWQITVGYYLILVSLVLFIGKKKK